MFTRQERQFLGCSVEPSGGWSTTVQSSCRSRRPACATSATSSVNTAVVPAAGNISSVTFTFSVAVPTGWDHLLHSSDGLDFPERYPRSQGTCSIGAGATSCTLFGIFVVAQGDFVELMVTQTGWHQPRHRVLNGVATESVTSRRSITPSWSSAT